MLCSVVANVPQEEAGSNWCTVPWFKRCAVVCRCGGFCFHGMDDDVHGVDWRLGGRVLKRFEAFWAFCGVVNVQALERQ